MPQPQMAKRTDPPQRPRGRPSKFGRPSRVVAVTLPDEAVERLRRINRDLGWAILSLLDAEGGAFADRRDSRHESDVELVNVADRRSLIVINRELIRHLPGVNIIPLRGNRAFVALDIDRGMSDLELAVADRLDEPAVDGDENRALEALRHQLASWRHDHDLTFHRRAIIVVERRRRRSGNGHRPPAGNGN